MDDVVAAASSADASATLTSAAASGSHLRSQVGGLLRGTAVMSGG
jgi:hypothetical protein